MVNGTVANASVGCFPIYTQRNVRAAGRLVRCVVPSQSWRVDRAGSVYDVARARSAALLHRGLLRELVESALELLHPGASLALIRSRGIWKSVATAFQKLSAYTVATLLHLGMLVITCIVNILRSFARSA